LKSDSKLANLVQICHKLEEILNIHLQLFSILRDKLPPELKGKTTMHLNEGATLKDLLRELEITHKVVISVNDIQETDHTRQLVDGERVKIFSSVGGG